MLHFCRSCLPVCQISPVPHPPHVVRRPARGQAGRCRASPVGGKAAALGGKDLCWTDREGSVIMKQNRKGSQAGFSNWVRGEYGTILRNPSPASRHKGGPPRKSITIFSRTSSANSTPVTRGRIPRPLAACSATVPCTHWATGAGGASAIRQTGSRTVPTASGPMSGRIMGRFWRRCRRFWS